MNYQPLALLEITLLWQQSLATESRSPQPVPMAAAIPAPRDVAYPGALQFEVDATDVAHRILKIHEILPVSPGELVLLYPQWIPGTRSPAGKIDSLAGLIIHAGTSEIE